MATILNKILIIFAVLDVCFGFRILRNENRRSEDNIWFVIVAFSAAVWSLFFGELLVQTDPEMAYLCRCIGLIGTFANLIATTFLFTGWMTMSRAHRLGFRIFTLLGLVIMPFEMRRSFITFEMTSFGMGYTFRKDIWADLYSVWSAGIAVIFLAILLHMIFHKNAKRREKRLGIYGLGALGAIGAGAVFDTVLPALGYAAIPGSTLTLFIGVVIEYTMIRFANSNKLGITTTAERLFTSSQAAICIYDENGDLIRATEQAAELLDIASHPADSCKLTDLLEAEYRPFEPDETVMNIEATVRGTDRHCSAEIHRVFDHFGDLIGYIALFNDITERYHFIEVLNEEKERADRANEAKSVFLANMSHEIRTPINTVLGMNEMIRREAGSDDIRGYSENIRAAGESLLSIINDILDFSKIEAGRVELVEGNYELADMLHAMTVMFGLKSNEKGLKFITKVDEKLPSGLFGDELRIRQVLINLLSNAVKYTERGSVTLHVFNAGSADPGCVRISFEVSDTGMGIRTEDKEKLFNSFTRLNGQQTHYIEGTGLGLNIVKGYTELLGAELEVESEYGSGSSFTFTVSQKINDPAPVGPFDSTVTAAAPKTEKESFRAPQARILAVDDNRMNLTVIRGLLKRTGVSLDTAGSGEACLELVRKKAYHIILMDHMMPVMDGVETLRRLKAMSPEENLSHDAAVIALTANALAGSKDIYLNYGFDGYLSKPVECDKLEAMLQERLPAELILQTEGSGKEDAGAGKTAGSGRTGENADTAGSGLTGGSSDIPADSAAAGSGASDGSSDMSADSSGSAAGSLSDEDIKQLAVYGIDINKGLQFCGDLDIYRSTAEAFCEAAEEMCGRLAELRQKGDVDNYRIEIHAVKSNARTLGQDDLYKYALAQEEHCKKGDFQPVAEAGDRPEQMISELSRGLSAIFCFADPAAGMEETGTVAAAAEDILAAADRALACLDDFDESGAWKEIDLLMTYDLGSEGGRDVRDAAAKLKGFDYDGAAAALKNMKQSVH